MENLKYLLTSILIVSRNKKLKMIVLFHFILKKNTRMIQTITNVVIIERLVMKGFNINNKVVITSLRLA